MVQKIFTSKNFFCLLQTIKVLAKSQNFLKFLISKSLLKSVFVYQTNCFLENYSGFS